MNDYPHDAEQEAIDIRRAIVRQQQASFESFIKTEERNRIIKLLIDADTTNLTTEELKGWYFALTVIKGESNE